MSFATVAWAQDRGDGRGASLARQEGSSVSPGAIVIDNPDSRGQVYADSVRIAGTDIIAGRDTLVGARRVQREIESSAAAFRLYADEGRAAASSELADSTAALRADFPAAGNSGTDDQIAAEVPTASGSDVQTELDIIRAGPLAIIETLGLREVLLGQDGAPPIAVPLVALFEDARVEPSGRIRIRADGVRWTTTAPASVTNAIAAYGFAACYTSAAGSPQLASTTSAAGLHLYYLMGDGSPYRLVGSGVHAVSATATYSPNTSYYLNDAGTLSPTADDAFDSLVMTCVAALGNGDYLIALADPRHFAR